MKKGQLILDVAGVLISNMTPGFWNDISKISNIPAVEWKNRFNAELRESFWSGKLPEYVFWQWLNDKYKSLDLQQAKSILMENLKALPAYEYIPKWSEMADIHLLSNHRNEWLDLLLAPIQTYLKSVTISSSVGLCKPDIELFKQVNLLLPKGQQVLFVDDQRNNLLTAEKLGWNTILADSDGQWIGELDKLRIT